MVRRRDVLRALAQAGCRGGVVCYGVPDIPDDPFSRAAEKLGAMIGRHPDLVVVKADLRTGAVEVVIVRGASLAAWAAKLPGAIDGFPVVVQHGDIPRVFGGGGYASPTRYAVLDPSRIRNEGS